MTTTTAPRARKCRRCSGTGQVFGGVCFRCDGSTIDPGPRARTAPSEAAQAEAAAVAALSTAIFGLDRADRVAAQEGLAHLKAHAPDRYTNALDSVRAGRLAAVVAHLVTYGKGL